jgi:hypothetical protein
MNGESVALGGHLPFEKITIIGEAGMPKAVFVPDGSEAIETNTAIGSHDESHFGVRENCSKAVVANTPPLSNRHHATVLPLWQEGESKTLRERTRQNLDYGINFQLVGWRLRRR